MHVSKRHHQIDVGLTHMMSIWCHFDVVLKWHHIYILCVYKFFARLDEMVRWFTQYYDFISNGMVHSWNRAFTVYLKKNPASFQWAKEGGGVEQLQENGSSSGSAVTRMSCNSRSTRPGEISRRLAARLDRRNFLVYQGWMKILLT